MISQVAYRKRYETVDDLFGSIYAITMIPVVIDTNVFVSALRGRDRDGGASRSILRAALTGKCVPLFGNALWLEYEDLLNRPVWTDATTSAERRSILNALASKGRWVSIYYGWRPNLPDEGDNHLIELAIAGNARAIITYNTKDFQRSQLIWRHLQILTPYEYIKRELL